MKCVRCMRCDGVHCVKCVRCMRCDGVHCVKCVWCMWCDGVHCVKCVWCMRCDGVHCVKCVQCMRCISEASEMVWCGAVCRVGQLHSRLGLRSSCPRWHTPGVPEGGTLPVGTIATMRYKQQYIYMHIP